VAFFFVTFLVATAYVALNLESTFGRRYGVALNLESKSGRRDGVALNLESTFGTP